MAEVDSRTLSPTQCRAARALLGWNQQDLAQRANVGTSTIADFEREKRTPVNANVDAIIAAFEAAGIRFLAGGVQGPLPTGLGNVPLGDGAPVRLVDATDLSQWAARNDAKATFPELIERLILATTGNLPNRLQFPSGDSIQQSGWDGVCDQRITDQFRWLPIGVSGWELGTQKVGVASKADGDYEKRSNDPLGLMSNEATFMFATLQRWKGGTKWAQEKCQGKIWKDVRVLDADDLVEWIALFPSVGYWLAARLGKYVAGTRLLEDFWREWRLSTEWPMSTGIVLAGRDQDGIESLKWLYGPPSVRSVQGDSVGEGVAFLYAAIDLLPDQYKKLYISRCLIASSPDAARALGSSPSPKVIVMEESEPGLASSLVEKGHHVLVTYGSRVGTTGLVTVLSRPQFEPFQEALEHMGIPETKAKNLTRDSCRKLSILRRLIPSTADAITPPWAEGQKGRLLIPALLAGAWDDACEGDREILATLSGGKFEAFAARCPDWIEFPDAPMRHAGTTWKIASPYDAWFRLAGLITKLDLETFAAASRTVLSAVDPRFDMDADDRFFAGVRGKLPKYSPWLISGITETLLLLAMFGDQIRVTPDGKEYADRIVHELLGNADERRWWSLSSQWPTLAEVSPDAFMSAIEDSLSKEGQPIMVLFKEDEGPAFGHAYHSHLLWALETLAWSPDYLSRAAEILARLSVLDPGGRWANRPANSLRSIFLLWLPQTNATSAQRFQVIDRLRKLVPDAAWKLMLSIFPKGYDSSSYNPRPKWRDFEVADLEQITNLTIFEGASGLAERLIKDAGSDPLRWAELIDHLAGFSPEWREQGWSRLAGVSKEMPDDAGKQPIWTALRNLISRHRSFKDAEWALPQEEVNRIEDIYKMFVPIDPVVQRAWLFAHDAQLLEAIRMDDWELREKQLTEKRTQAIAEILELMGFSGVDRLINQAKEPRLVGIAYLHASTSPDDPKQILNRFLESDTPSRQQFAHGVVAAGNWHHSWQWSESVLELATKERWSEAAITSFLLALPSEGKVWMKVASFGDSVRKAYWQRTNFIPYNESVKDKLYAIEQMVDVGRARDLVDRLAGSAKGIPTSTIVDVLAAAATSPWPEDGNAAVMSQWGVAELLKVLDADESLEDAVVARLEWVYLALLEHSQRTPIVLHRFMAADPGFFVQVLSAIFRAHSESAPKLHEPSKQEKAMATQAFRLLESWRTVPGNSSSGLDADALKAWVREAHRLAVQAERGAVGDQYIGRALSFSPIGSDGIWPHEAVRNIIEDMRNAHMEKGMSIGVFNQQGVTSRLMTTGGTIERDKAKRYHAWSDATKIEWPRTSAVLKDIARSFENTARHHDDHAERVDWEY
ncbi:MAG TPA: helix-turn-helix domain-containing protein [Terracidiphilus sp.]|nr:helix-turn-helix domain-containing protein [Terracidiphilus sp.]